MPRSFQYTVIGRVQGVFFRVFTQQAAQDLGIRGYVRNDPNGDVSGVAQGDDEDALAKFKDAIWKGPEHARVVDVKFSNEEELEEYQYEGFEVVRRKK
ncbi:Acylphosphatase-like domain-containing protein [Gautieria morchelliformis]|nr:Acylphosphatase-like domain-containing protein [Gautieria morchelliformis]